MQHDNNERYEQGEYSVNNSVESRLTEEARTGKGNLVSQQKSQMAGLKAGEPSGITGEFGKPQLEVADNSSDVLVAQAKPELPSDVPKPKYATYENSRTIYGAMYATNEMKTEARANQAKLQDGSNQYEHVYSKPQELYGIKGNWHTQDLHQYGIVDGERQELKCQSCRYSAQELPNHKKLVVKEQPIGSNKHEVSVLNKDGETGHVYGTIEDGPVPNGKSKLQYTLEEIKKYESQTGPAKPKKATA